MTTTEFSVDLVKRVARTIAKAQGESWTEVNEVARKEYRRVARQALIAEHNFVSKDSKS